MADEPSHKAVDVLVDALTETLKSIDSSVLLAILSATFVLVHGVQDDFVHDMNARMQRVNATRTSQAGTATATTTSSRPAADTAQIQRTSIPILGAEAELFTAGFIALILQWVFTIRAALRAGQLRRICARLAELDPATLSVAVLFPSFAMGTHRSKLWLCILLAALGFGSCFVFYYPLDERAHRELSERIWSAIIMFVPPGVLYHQLRQLATTLSALPPPNPHRLQSGRRRTEPRRSRPD